MGTPYANSVIGPGSVGGHFGTCRGSQVASRPSLHAACISGGRHSMRLRLKSHFLMVKLCRYRRSSQGFFGKRPPTLAIERALSAERVGAVERDTSLKLSGDPIPAEFRR